MIIIYITTSSKEEAGKIAQHLLKNKLIVCANFFPINSLYLDSGKIKEDDEFVLLLKTVEDKYNEIVKEVTKLHSYSVPCILKMDVVPNEAYGKWLNGQFMS
jgi:periplasmic divalent cation tolerance protein